ncbi:MAG: lamin tail domain-containing protein, partial [Candidatus Kerfeldbacteria bacterium]|nr:lamin tail domain-containing protein [Candidatus Kerfeldbacteria bacterium]
PAAVSRLALEPNIVDPSVSLVNSKLQIALYDANSTLVDRADDGSGNPLAGVYTSGAAWKSMERNKAGADGTAKESWHTSVASIGFDDGEREYGTPGSANSNSKPNIVLNVPETATVGETVYLDSSQSTDAENDPLVYHWDFGDGKEADGPTPTHVFDIAGTYIIRCVVTDGQDQADEEKLVTVRNAPAPVQTQQALPPVIKDDGGSPLSSAVVRPAPAIADSAEHNTTPFQTSRDILLNELQPNPAGPDGDSEFLELKNTGSSPVDLRGWSLLVAGKKFAIASSMVLDGGDTIVLNRQQTKLVLGNAGGTVYLLDPFGKIMSGVQYRTAESGMSFSRNPKDQWRWTEIPTPGEENVFTEVEKSPPSNEEEGVAPATDSTVDITDIPLLKQRQPVRVVGVVTTKIGLLGSREFAITDGDASILVAVTQGDLPELEAGQRVVLRGTVGTSQGEPKVNVHGDSGITVQGSTTIEPLPFRPDLLTGSLTSINGTVSAKQRSAFTLSTEAGDITVHLMKASGVAAAEITENTELHIVGVWKRSTKELLPRAPEDVLPRGEVKGTEVAASSKPSEDSPPPPTTVQLEARAVSPLPKLLGLAGLAAAAGVVGFFRYRQRRKTGIPS